MAKQIINTVESKVGINKLLADLSISFSHERELRTLQGLAANRIKEEHKRYTQANPYSDILTIKNERIKEAVRMYKFELKQIAEKYHA